MTRRFEELDWRPTPMGEISLRRRVHPSLGVDVYEVKLGDDFLMSSLFTVAEVELARLALARLTGSAVDVVVGGLGLGYTAAAVLDDARVRSVIVVEALGEVLEWHERGLLPLSARLTSDPRCRFVHGDFFRLVAEAEAGAEGPEPVLRCDAMVVDIDHSPRNVLHPSHAGFYTPEGLQRVATLLRPGGVFGLWSDDPPDPDVERLLAGSFARASSHVVTFPRHDDVGDASNTVYLAEVG